MAKVDVTKELSDIIKNLRIKNKVKAIEVAQFIEKSPAYISKLENSEIKTIEYEELISILKYITNHSDEDLVEYISDISSNLSSSEFNKQTWLVNFDTVERRLPVPSELIDFINKKILDLGLTIPVIVDYINQNNELIQDNNINDFSKYKSNHWYSKTMEDDRLYTFILMKLEIPDVLNLFEKRTDTSNYVTILSILYNILRLEHRIDDNHNEEENGKIKDEAIKILNSYKFYSLEEKNKLLSITSTQQELNAILNEFDIENGKLINEFLSYISYLSDWNVRYINEKLISFNKNLQWDSSYILTLSSLPFFELSNISKSMKSSLLNDIKKLIGEYKNKPEIEKITEMY